MEVLVVMAAAAGLGAFGWLHFRRRADRALGPASSPFSEDAAIALHLAAHEARSRGQALAPIHVFYALVQDQALAGAIERTGGDVGAIEDRVFRALEEGERAGAELGRPGEGGLSRHGDHVLNLAAHFAFGAGRRAGCTDLFASLVAAAPRVAALTEAGGVAPADVLFTAVHGVAERELPDQERGPVELVLVNDDVTAQELVVTILREVFGMAEDDARQKMLEAHSGGRAVLGRLPPAEARPKLERSRELARARGYPLWIRAEPAGPG